MTLFGLLRNPKHSDVVPFQEIEPVAKLTCFFGAARGVVLGIEIKEKIISFEISQVKDFSVLVLGREIRRLLSRSEARENHKPNTQSQDRKKFLHRLTYTANLKCMMSPSRTTYSFPSRRSAPASRTALSLLYLMR